MPSKDRTGHETGEPGRAGAPRRRAPQDGGRSAARPVSVVRTATLLLALAAFAVSIAAAVIALTRPAAAVPAACRTIAWDALPAVGALPTGWSLNGTNLDADGYSTALVGPSASNASTPPDSIFLKLTCFGPDAHDAFTRSETLARASGATEISFAAVGDESFEARNADGSAIAFVRRGSLVANFGVSARVDPAILGQAARAVDAAMATSQGATPSPSTGAALPSSTSAASEPSAAPRSTSESGSPAPSSSPQHAAPDLEALLPRSVNGTPLETQSTDGAAGLGQDASSKSLIASLESLGKKASDLQIALAYDPTAALDLNILAFRANGVDGSTLKDQVLKSWLAGGGSGIRTAAAAVGGKQVTKVDYGDGGTVDYLYVHSNVLIDVASGNENLAAQVLAKLP